MKSDSDNDITVFREYTNIYNAKTLLKNILQIEFEAFYQTTQPARKQTADIVFNAFENKTPDRR